MTQRQENRRILKETLLAFFWDEQPEIPRKEYPVTVEISSALQEKLSRERILEEQIFQTIDFCQRHNRTILNEETGTLSGYCVIGYMTCLLYTSLSTICHKPGLLIKVGHLRQKAVPIIKRLFLLFFLPLPLRHLAVPYAADPFQVASADAGFGEKAAPISGTIADEGHSLSLIHI